MILAHVPQRVQAMTLHAAHAVGPALSRVASMPVVMALLQLAGCLLEIPFPAL